MYLGGSYIGGKAQVAWLESDGYDAELLASDTEAEGYVLAYSVLDGALRWVASIGGVGSHPNPNPNPNLRWGVSIGGVGSQWITGLATESSTDNLYLTGYFGTPNPNPGANPNSLPPRLFWESDEFWRQESLGECDTLVYFRRCSES